MDIIQSGSAMRQTLIHAAKNSPRPATDNASMSSQEQSKNRLVAARAVRAEDIPQTARHDESLHLSNAGSVEKVIHYNYNIEENLQRYRAYHFAAGDFMNANFYMSESREGFKAEVAAALPTIRSKDFGLSVDAEGEPMILNKGGRLTEEQHEQLTHLLQNSSHYSNLKRYTNEIMDISIRWAETGNGSETMDSFHKGGVNLTINKQNFHQIYDFFSDQSTYAQLNDAPKESPPNKVSVYTSGQWVDIRV